jgi:hypothetical protein
VSARTKLFAVVSLVALIVTVLWLALLIADTAGAGPLDTFEQVLAHVSDLDALYYLTYANAALTVLATTLLFAVLYLHCKTTAPELALLGLVFVPAYAALNLVVYLSQLTVVPALITAPQQVQHQAAAELLLQQTIQMWSGSAISFLNGLGYAISGIPSIILGAILLSQRGLLRPAGALLALNGMACLVGLIGMVTGSDLLGNGLVVGGVLYLLALIPLNVAFWRGRQ